MPRSVRVLGPAALIVVALAATFAGLAYGGGAAEQLIQDPGPIARYGVPIAKLFVNLGAAGMIGALVLAVWALSPKNAVSAPVSCIAAVVNVSLAVGL